MNPNDYTKRWYDVFESTHPYTATEVEFLTTLLPNPPYARVLDLCCGRGRHAIPLARQGYDVVGVDVSEDALTEARRRAALGQGLRAEFVKSDVRDLTSVHGTFDAAFILWQSFGYFGREEDVLMLHGIVNRLNHHARIALDIYNLEWWSENQGEEVVSRGGRTVQVTRKMTGQHLVVDLQYNDGQPGERFEWDLYSVAELQKMGEECGLRTLLICTQFDRQRRLIGTDKALQIAFERA
jgi:SAM-dependent methyltransferase